MTSSTGTLPVTTLDHDDRIEVPEGLLAVFDGPSLTALGGTPSLWPMLLGYSRVIAKPDAAVIARFSNDPLLVAVEIGIGQSVAPTSDLAPHWTPPEFVNWTHYQDFWISILAWSAGARSTRRPKFVPQLWSR